ncbi:unnamed protein product [Zymoseptoria tritici ST99CH_1A5]|uniref:Uncharacterized protein n=2 Tax=Zymoseptoria tritici TaxID=1047171 RepID=A0A2H1G6N9_ZYMTR|nr:unnamed protein product [Zymoseptoria tritici ST99CH_1E4]SMY23108.1 unnamed protein product [Zymoseptoria tritici ST99CH_1A5]
MPPTARHGSHIGPGYARLQYREQDCPHPGSASAMRSTPPRIEEGEERRRPIFYSREDFPPIFEGIELRLFNHNDNDEYTTKKTSLPITRKSTTMQIFQLSVLLALASTVAGLQCYMCFNDES